MFSANEGKAGDVLKVYQVNESFDNGSVPAFLKKLWTLVDDQTTDELICWGYNGTSFHVFDQARFAREILPQYFKHSNIASFIRQLNMYGFRKVVGVETGALKVEKDDLEFYHPYFLQNHEELLENIKRKVATGVKVDSVRLKQEDVSKVLADVRSMKGKQEAITQKMDSLKRENEVLWREVANMRQKHLKQQQIVNKLIQFLVTLVRGNREIPTTSRKRVMPLMLNDSSQLSAAKQPKLNRQLSIEEKTPAYTVQSPQAPTEKVNFQPQTLSGPIIHELVSESLPSATSVATPVTTTKQVVEKLPEAKSTVSRIRSSTSPKVNKGDKKKVVAKSTNLPDQTVGLGGDVNDHLEVLQTDLDELKDLLSGQYSLDPSMLMGLFTPETPISQLEKGIETSAASSSLDNAGTILGNELIQYEPQEDLSNLPLFDLGDNLMVPELDDPDAMNLIDTHFDLKPESLKQESLIDNDNLMTTPLMTPQSEELPKLD